jgi:hypothetical protein
MARVSPVDIAGVKRRICGQALATTTMPIGPGWKRDFVVHASVTVKSRPGLGLTLDVNKEKEKEKEKELVVFPELPIGVV